jgi:hypothetical protein
MSIWCSGAVIPCLDYGHSGVYPWENRVRDSSTEVDLAHVYDYVRFPDEIGEKVLPFLRLSIWSLEEDPVAVLTEAQAEKLRDALTVWLDRPKRGSRRRPTQAAHV